MMHVASDDSGLINALEQRFRLEQFDAPMAIPVLSNSDMLIYQLPHNGPRAAAQYGYLRGAWRSAGTATHALIVALSAANRHHPAFIHEIRRGRERHALSGVTQAAEALELETLAVSVLPDIPAETLADSDESPRAVSEARRDLERAQAVFTAEAAAEPTVSLMLWWLLGAVRSLATATDRPATDPPMYPLLIPKLQGAAALESLDTIEGLLAYMRT